MTSLLGGPDDAFLGGPDEKVNFSSSEGPRKLFFTPDGHPYDTPKDIKKPDVTAADGVTTSVPNPNKNFQPFFGTSAAAPQVAGIAALMWSKYPSLKAEDIKDALRKSAIQIEGSEEWNPLSGYGIVNAMRALCAAIEKAEGREGSGGFCAEYHRRSRKAGQQLQMSMAKRHSAPLK